jgi:4-aminobutyrate aminotransferase-like enzyme
MGAQMMTGNPAQRSWIGHMDPAIHHLPFPYPEALEGTTGKKFFEQSIEALLAKGLDPDQDICGVLLETFQGWGAIFYPDDYVQAFAQFCHDHKILLAFDEMQAGFARTGLRFGFQHYGVEPDLICCGKGMGSGLPLSGVLGRKEIMDLPDVGDMSSTHSANPLCCAAGLKTIEEIERLDLVAETDRKGKILFNGLKEIQARHPDRIAHVFGRGLIGALIVRDPCDGSPDGEFASRVSERCMQKGVLVVHTGRESIKLGPPLTITDDALSEGIETIGEAIAEIAGEAS